MKESWVIDHDICMTNDYLNNNKFWKLATAQKYGQHLHQIVIVLDF